MNEMTTPTDLAQAITDYLCEQEYDIGGRAELLKHVSAAIAAHESRAQPKGHEDLVTRQSAIDALSYVAKFSGVGTWEQACRMLVEAQPASVADVAAAKRAIEARNRYLREHPGDAVDAMVAALQAAAPQPPAQDGE